MNKSRFRLAAFSAMAVLAAGCAGYSWKNSVPEDMRTVSVPVFRNETHVTGLGNAVTRQILREFQRGGTFKIVAVGDAAVEVQGVLENTSTKAIAFERSTGDRYRERRLEVKAVISIVDKKLGKVIVDNREYKASTTYLDDGDMLTRQREASGRIGEDIARQVVDDVVSIFSKKGEEAENGR